MVVLFDTRRVTIHLENLQKSGNWKVFGENHRKWQRSAKSHEDLCTFTV